MKARTPAPTPDTAGSRIERLQSWIAALLSALLHLLVLILAMLSTPVTTSPPQGGAAGSPMVVDFVGITPPQPAPVSPADTRPSSQPAQAPPATSRVQSTLAPDADDPIPPEADATSDATTAFPVPRPVQPPDTPAPEPAEATEATPPPTPQRPNHTWGQPPGMLPQDTAPVNAGRARSPTSHQGRSNGGASSGPSLEVGGYQVYYDLRRESRLREWRDQGMTEISFPLPGTRQHMVCPLETALQRESGPCRLLDPDDPEMEAIGDAREVINMHQVYRRGERLWSGPRPYR